MIQVHEGYVELNNSFSEACSFLISNNNMKLTTSTGKNFIAVADKAIKRKDGKEYDVIRFFRGNNESARAYECCGGIIIIAIGQGLGCMLNPWMKLCQSDWYQKWGLNYGYL